MTTAVVGAGPIGMVCATALAGRGEEVLLVDPDPGPAPDGTWRRHGVMQWSHPHFFRFQVRQVLRELVPEMYDAVLAAGGRETAPPPGVPPQAVTLACRRSTFETALRRALAEQVTSVCGRAERLVVDGDRVTGVVVDGTVLDVDRVVVATGRAGALGDALRPAVEGGPCGVSYVSRMYRARPGVAPLTSWNPLGAQYDGFVAIAFPQDDGTLSALVLRPSDDAELARLWSNEVYDRAVQAIPNLAPWTDPEGFEPITDVMRGGSLHNAYRGQGDVPAGLYFVGDAVCATNPSTGSGTALGLQQAQALVGMLGEHTDPKDASAAFDAWCTEQVRPWFDDHVRNDAYARDRYAGRPLDVDAPLPTDLVCDAAVELPELQSLTFPYQGLMVLPTALAAVEEPVRDLLRTGWRPPYAEGPTRDELVAHLDAVPV